MKNNRKKPNHIKPGFWNNPQKVPYLFILPNMLLFGVFMILPLVMTFGISFLKWGGIGKPTFNGIDNYVTIFSDEVFRLSLWNTLKFTVLTVPVIMIVALLLAMTLNRKIPLRGFVRSSIYMPAVVSLVAAGMTFLWMFNPQIGFVNFALEKLGLPQLDWVNDPSYAMIMVVIATLWTRIGYNMVIYLAGLQSISPEYYEAAQIDGANRWQQFRYITMPQLRFTHVFIFLTCVIYSFRAFDLIYTMTKGGPLNSTKTMVVYIFDMAFQKNKFGVASAAGVVLFLILLVFTIIRMKNEKEEA